VLTRRELDAGVDVITRCHRNLLSDSQQRTRAARRSYAFWRPVRVITLSSGNGHFEFKNYGRLLILLSVGSVM
jgi:hypothetical protein